MKNPRPATRSLHHGTVVAAAVVVVVALVGCGGSGGDSTTPTPTPTPLPVTGTFDYRGIDHVSWWHDEYQGSTGSSARQTLAAAHANWSGVLLTWYMPDRPATSIAPDSQRTPSDGALTAAIGDLHQLGVKVMLKPHVDTSDGSWRGSITPSDANAWFASYSAYMTQMARFAEQQQVEMLCIGTELKTMSGATHSAHWTDLIKQIRAQYHGLLTYAANANSPGDEFTSVCFWDQVDLIGLDAYAALTNKNDPSQAELVAGWSQGPNGDMLAAYRNLASSRNKSVIFTEIGYRSMAGANRAPWDFSASAAYDPTEQSNCYYAAFSVFLPERVWMKGAFWWAWPVAPPSATDTDYTPRNKPAGALLTERYGAT
jgi:serralysin